MFGGHYTLSSDVVLRDAWALSLGGTPTWTPIVPADTIAGRPIGMAAFYDRASDRMIVIGGELGEPWALSLGDAPTWRHVPTSTPSPAISSPLMHTFDPDERRIMVEAGYDLWSLSLTEPAAWSHSTIEGAFPLFPDFSVAVFDSARHSLLLTGAGGTGMLSTSAPPVWTNVQTLPRWRPMQSASAVFDSRRDRMIVVGESDRTWALPLGGPPAWSPIADQAEFGPRRGHGVIYDPRRDRIVAYGGERSGTAMNDTWVLSLEGTSWVPLETAGTPPPAHPYISAIYDPLGDRLLVFGGSDGSSRAGSNETWALTLDDPPTWRRVTTLDSPAGRRLPQVVYDASRHRMLLFGGSAQRVNNPGNDFWALPLTDDPPSWQQINPLGDRPTGREGGCAVYDPVRDRLVIFSGRFDIGDGTSNFGYRNDAIAATLAPFPGTWSRLAPLDGAPLSRSGAATIYDPDRDRMVFFSGDSLTDTWALSWNRPALPAASCPGELEWTPGEPVRFTDLVTNPQRFAQPCVWEMTSRRAWPGASRTGEGMVPAGGSITLPFAIEVPDTAAGGRDSLELTVTLVSVPQSIHCTHAIHVPSVLVNLAGASADTGGVSLAWQAEESGTATANVQRRTEGSEWNALATIVSDQSGRFEYQDTAVTPGLSYHYRLGIERLGREFFSGETSIEVPLPPPPPAPPPPLALAGLRPNPARGEFAVGFTLADASPARLEMIDVSGRRVLDLEVGALGPGAHSLGAAELGSLRAGHYVIRLTQGGRSLTWRGAVIR